MSLPSQTSSLTTREPSASPRPASVGLAPLLPPSHLCATFFLCPHLTFFLGPHYPPPSLPPSLCLSLPQSTPLPSSYSLIFPVPLSPLPPTTSCPLGTSLPVWVRGELVQHVALCETPLSVRTHPSGVLEHAGKKSDTKRTSKRSHNAVSSGLHAWYTHSKKPQKQVYISCPSLSDMTTSVMFCCTKRKGGALIFFLHLWQLAHTLSRK